MTHAHHAVTAYDLATFLLLIAAGIIFVGALEPWLSRIGNHVLAFPAFEAQCTDCHGSGEHPGDDGALCAQCNGRGTVPLPEK